MGVATFLYPGLSQVSRATYTCSHGETPGVASIECPPSAVFALTDGALEIQDGSGKFIRLRDCRVAGATNAGQAGQGSKVTIHIHDRRWKWAFGEVFGSYNIRREDADIEPATVKKPQELAVLLFKAMGEIGYNVSQLPNDTFPEVIWKGDNPARALAELADRLGCRLVFDPIMDRALICRLGVGSILAGGQINAGGYTLQAPLRPDYIAAQCGDTAIQGVFRLRAVGLDTDGEWKPIDTLSYKPANGWAGQIPGVFSGVVAQQIAPPLPGEFEAFTLRELAKKTVWKNYQIYGLLGSNARPYLQNLLGAKYRMDAGDLQAVLPLRNELVQIDNVTGKPGDPLVQGIFATLAGGWLNSEPWAQMKNKDFALRRDLGIVEFSEYTFKWATAGSPTSLRASADLYLTCAFSLRDQDTKAFHQYRRIWANQGPKRGTGAYAIKNDETNLTYTLTYDANGTITGNTNNLAALNIDCDRVIAAHRQKFETTNPLSNRYPGIVLMQPDGAIQQIEWEVSDEGAFTTASRNDEFSLTVPDYKERRMFSALGDMDRSNAIRRRLEEIRGRG